MNWKVWVPAAVLGALAVTALRRTSTGTLSPDVIQAATGASRENLQKWLPILTAGMARWGIRTVPEQLAFLAQIGHESGGLRFVRELSTGEQYEGRGDLGNTEPGDGVRYKGRGLIQLTGRANYRRAGQALGKPFEENPELVEEPQNAMDVAGWYWRKGSALKDLNDLADTMQVGKPMSGVNLDAFTRITKGVNGGLNGLSHRIALWESGRNALLVA